MYVPEVRARVLSALRRKFKDEGYDEQKWDAKIPQAVQVALVCPGIAFEGSPVKVRLDGDRTSTDFIARPKDSSKHGKTHVKISITDPESGQEYFSETFPVLVADFAFLHVPRPLLSKVLAAASGLGSLAMFLLAFLAAIDKTAGFVSGTTTALFAAMIYSQSRWAFRRTETQCHEYRHTVS